MAFDPDKRISALAELRRRQIIDEASRSPTKRLLQAEELLALAWSLHGPPEEPGCARPGVESVHHRTEPGVSQACAASSF